MLSLTDVVVIAIMVAIIMMYFKKQYGEVVYVRSKVDDRRYLVQKKPDAQQAADLLAQCNSSLLKLVQHMRAKFSSRQDVHRLYNNYNPDAISEGGMEHGYTSYSVNKGEKIVLCIRQKDGQFVSQNIIMYVAIHELAHIMTHEVGHTDAFWANFKFLLREAMTIGLYEYQDFAKEPQPYCGIQITSSVV
jgi:predicted metal-dependent hydrolase